MAYGKNKTTDKIVLLLNHIFFLIRILQYEISFNSGLRIHRNPKYWNQISINIKNSCAESNILIKIDSSAFQIILRCVQKMNKN